MHGDVLSYDFIVADSIIEAIDEFSLRAALKTNGFEIEPIKPWDWIVRGCRVSAHTAMTWGENPDRESNAKIGKDLKALSNNTKELWEKLIKLSPDQDNAIFEYSYRHWNDDGRVELEDGKAVDNPSEFKRFSDAIVLLDWLSDFLDRAAETAVAVEQSHKWKGTEELNRRIVLAQCLSTIFEDGFGRKPIASRFESSSNASLMGQWPIFWESVAYLIWGKQSLSNLGTIFRIARIRHKQKRVEFVE